MYQKGIKNGETVLKGSKKWGKWDFGASDDM
jgi:hypothetical protein